jgi:hypothetical protein
MVLVKMLMKIGPPMMRWLLVMIMALISSSQRKLSLAESLCRRAKVLLPKFRLETAVLHPESPLLIFFLGQMGLCTRRWAPKAGQGPHKPPGRALVTRGHLDDPSGISFLQYFLFIPK